MSNTELKIGFIGLGNMGFPAAKNLIIAGYDLVVHDIDEEPVAKLEELGAESEQSPGGVARESDLVITFLPEPAHVRQVAFGDGGIVDANPEGLVHIDMSTIGPSASQEIADELEGEGIRTLDAPVSSGEKGAKEGSMSIMVGGDEEIVNEYNDLFEVMGGKITHVGERGAGQTAKICNNMAAAAILSSLAEILVFAEKANISQRKLVEAMEGGAAQSWFLENRAEEMIEKDLEPGFFGSYMYKDLRLAVEGAEDFGAVTPITSVSHELYKSMEEKDRGHLDMSGVITVMEDLSGVSED